MDSPDPGVIAVVIFPPQSSVKTVRNLVRCTAAGLLCALAAAQTPEIGGPLSASDDGAIPQPLTNDAFQTLLANPPFVRSLGVSDSLILTGVAQFGDEIFATLLDTKTFSSQVVSQTPNGAGWQLVGVGGNPDKIDTWTARIQIPGGEIISIRYQKPPSKLARTSSGSGGGNSSSGGSRNGSSNLSSAQVEEAQKAAVNYREGFTSDGYPRQPPPEMVAKLYRLSVDQRADINRQMISIRNRGMGMEERRRIYESMVDRAAQGRR